MACLDNDMKSHLGAELLLNDKRCDVNVQDVNGWTALMYAAWNVQSEEDAYAQCMKLLLKHPQIDVNVQSGGGNNPLMLACHGGKRPDVVAQMLLSDNRYDVNQPNDKGTTTLMIAAKLVTSESDVHAWCTRMLLNHPRIDVNAQSKHSPTALHGTCEENTKSHLGAQLLLNNKQCDVNAKDVNGNTALVYAAWNVQLEDGTHVQCMKLLLNHPQIDLNARNKKGMNVLIAACRGGKRPDVVTQILLSDDRCNINQADDDGRTALMTAAILVTSEADAHARCTNMLLDHPRIDVNARDKYLRTALHYACSEDTNSHLGAELLLNDKRCDVNAQDDKGYTALMYAAGCVQSVKDAHAQCITLLLNHPRIDVNARDNYSRTALHTACGEDTKSHLGAELLLNDKRCDVNAQKINGFTALMSAANHVQSEKDAHAQCMKLLLNHSRIDLVKH